ncbi:MAG: sialate O-acetylesterase [Sphingobacteriales bacterium]|nr:sialate O-acetylesterase [Sphingobacteriales bacterium]
MALLNYQKIMVAAGLPVLVLFFNSCQKELKQKEKPLYDVFLLAGQSNTLSGYGLNPGVDQVVTGIKQLGRFNEDNYQIIEATEPLQNHTPNDSCIGFTITFAKLYANSYLQKGRQALIIPCGANGSGFLNNHWNRGNDYYKDAIERVNKVLDTYPGSELKAVLWHQGEADFTFGVNYYKALDNMIASMRTSFHQSNRDSIPFISGGFVPYWVDMNTKFRVVDSVLRATPRRVALTGFADPRVPFIIVKPDNSAEAIHFDANGQREMGKRYFYEYQRLVK